MADGQGHHTTALGEYVDRLMSANVATDPVTIYTDGQWYGWTSPVSQEARWKWLAVMLRARNAGLVSRCSPERPCEARNPAHLLLWGECWHTDHDEIPDPGVQAR